MPSTPKRLGFSKPQVQNVGNWFLHSGAVLAEGFRVWDSGLRGFGFRIVASVSGARHWGSTVQPYNFDPDAEGLDFGSPGGGF